MMKKIAAACLLMASHAFAQQSTTINVPITVTHGVEAPGPSQALFSSPYYSCVRNFYVATTGSDSNSGTSAGSPWLTIAHADTSGRTGGDCINVAPGSYSAFNGSISHGGTIASSTGYVTYRCTAPGFTSSNPTGGCVITDGGKSVCTGSGAGCGTAYPSYLIFDGFSFISPAQNTFATAFTCYNGDVSPNPGCHHWIIVNNVISGYGQSGIQMNDSEWEFSLHNLIYNNSSAAGCDGGAQGSGISYAASIPVPGYSQTADDIGPTPKLGIYSSASPNPIHQYIEWNVLYNNHMNCASGSATDGNGIILDTNDNSSTGVNYGGGFLVAFNVSYNNGGGSIHGVSTHKATWANNTCYNAYLDTNNTGSERACLDIDDWADTILNNVIVSPQFAGSCGSPITTWNNPIITNSTGLAGSTPNALNNNISFQVGTNVCGRTDYQGAGDTYSCAANRCATNPLWVNVGNTSRGTESTQPVGSNFALQATSPAIGNGQTQPYLPAQSVDVGACHHTLVTCP